MWPLLLPLAVLAAAQGAQYGDYGAVKMPAYGDYDVPREAASDDYRRPAAASLDYKYEEENKGNPDKALNKEYRSGDAWQKPSRKQAKRTRNDEEYSDRSDGRSRDSERKYRAGHDRLPVNHKRHPAGDEDEFSIEKYIQGINENNLEADVTHANRRTTDKIIRRKSRERENDLAATAAAFKEQEFDEEALPPAMGRAPPPVPRDEGRFGTDFREDVRSGERIDPDERASLTSDLAVLPVERRIRPDAGEMGPRRRPYAPEAEEPSPPRLRPAQRARLDLGAAAYDSEYYDLKRMRNMRRKPDPDHRPEASEEENINMPPGIPFAELDELDRESGRRALSAPGRRPPPRRPTTRRRLTSPPTTKRTTRRTTTSITTTTLSTTTASTTTKAAPTLTPARNHSKELSLAEKSRLSIMKKASRKERVGGPSTTKPPVLLQVTKMMPTVVLVASSTTGDPWMRAREVSGDSPETLAKVRQLMRAKLVANAKDIRDLTEDWDQEVCDYVDVKLLENAAPHPATTHCYLLVALCALLSQL